MIWIAEYMPQDERYRIYERDSPATGWYIDDCTSDIRDLITEASIVGAVIEWR